jgi:signal transduction histidine kinase/ActR/RegA family two-component response regulator
MRFRDLPIRRKLTWVSILTSSLALLIASVAFVSYEVITFRRAMVRELSTQAQIIGYNSAAALLFNDRNSAAETLSALRAEPHIISASVYARDGAVFATYVRSGVTQLPPLTEPPVDDSVSHRFTSSELVLYEDIVVDGERIGRVRMLSDLSGLYARLRGYLGIVGIAFLGSIIAAAGISGRMQRTISGPILHLVDRARIVTTERNYTVRAIPTSEDELGLLIRTFNEMLAQIQQRDEALERARDDAQTANRAKDEFLAVVSHELRTPLTPVLAWARMLRSGQLDPAAAGRALESIERNVRAQAQLIGDLLDVSRIITGKLRLDVRPVELMPVVEAAIESVRPTADVKGVRLQTVLDPRAGLVAGDPDRLQQVIWNLLSNAIKFTPKGGRVEVRLQRVNSHSEIVVSDTGRGISPEFLPYVFDRFRQADSTLTRSHGGLGLGLAIVRHLIELHGGRVRAESPGESQGATFTVELPVAVVQAVPSPSYVHPTASGDIPFTPSPTLTGVHVLVVDDDADTLETVHAILTQCGAEIRMARSAAEALQMVESCPPHLLISDIGMPDEDGYTFIRKVRALGANGGGTIPAIALTAYARVEDRLKVLSAGFQMHVAKPIEPAELVAVVANLAEWRTKGSGDG